MVTGVYMGCYWLWTLSRRPSRRVCVFVGVCGCLWVYVSVYECFISRAFRGGYMCHMRRRIHVCECL